MQKIYLLDIGGFTDEEGLKALLPQTAVVKAERYAERADRLCSLFGSMLIEKFTSGSPLLFGTHGKPYKEAPPFFNLSHSGDKIGIFSDDDGEVGFDIQQIRTCNVKLAERIFPEKEIEISCAADFARFWTMKESAAKLTGEGIISPGKQVLTDIDAKSFNFGGEKVYYKTFLQGEYAITACAQHKISAEISEITVKDLAGR